LGASVLVDLTCLSSVVLRGANLERLSYPRAMARKRTERSMKPRMAISDSARLFVNFDGKRVFCRGFRAL